MKRRTMRWWLLKASLVASSGFSIGLIARWGFGYDHKPFTALLAAINALAVGVLCYLRGRLDEQDSWDIDMDRLEADQKRLFRLVEALHSSPDQAILTGNGQKKPNSGHNR